MKTVTITEVGFAVVLTREHKTALAIGANGLGAVYRGKKDAKQWARELQTHLDVSKVSVVAATVTIRIAAEPARRSAGPGLRMSRGGA